jgi:hypothetical protein
MNAIPRINGGKRRFLRGMGGEERRITGRLDSGLLVLSHFKGELKFLHEVRDFVDIAKDRGEFDGEISDEDFIEMRRSLTEEIGVLENTIEGDIFAKGKEEGIFEKEDFIKTGGIGIGKSEDAIGIEIGDRPERHEIGRDFERIREIENIIGGVVTDIDGGFRGSGFLELDKGEGLNHGGIPKGFKGAIMRRGGVITISEVVTHTDTDLNHDFFFG